MGELNRDALDKIDAIVEKHKDQPGPTKLMLHDVQKELGYIPFTAMEKIAEAAHTSVSEVYGVVTFYTQFTTEPKGKHVINVCMGTACYVKGAQTIINDVISLTNAPINGTSKDGIFSLDATRCLGACGLAPVVIVDGKVYGNANESTIVTDLIHQIIETERLNG